MLMNNLYTAASSAYRTLAKKVSSNRNTLGMIGADAFLLSSVAATGVKDAIPIYAATTEPHNSGTIIQAKRDLSLEAYGLRQTSNDTSNQKSQLPESTESPDLTEISQPELDTPIPTLDSTVGNERVADKAKRVYEYFKSRNLGSSYGSPVYKSNGYPLLTEHTLIGWDLYVVKVDSHIILEPGANSLIISKYPALKRPWSANQEISILDLRVNGEVDYGDGFLGPDTTNSVNFNRSLGRGPEYEEQFQETYEESLDALIKHKKID